MPARVLLQDFTGVPAVVDLAAMRDAIQALGGDPARINPVVPADLVIDHSVQVDRFGTSEALGATSRQEYERNHERYALLRWAQEAFHNFRVVPPGTGICHQVNLEYLAPVVAVPAGRTAADAPSPTPGGHGFPHHHDQRPGRAGLGRGRHRGRGRHAGPAVLYADSRGRGCAADRPAARGDHRHGPGAARSPSSCAREGVVDKFVEFFGPGLDALSLPDRAVIANMAPEYGATMGFFPVDAKTLRLPAPHRPDEEPLSARGGLLPGAGPVPRPRPAPNRSSPTSWSWTSTAWSRPWPGPNGPRTAWPSAVDRVPGRPDSPVAAGLRPELKQLRARRPSRWVKKRRISATGRWSSPPSPAAPTHPTPS